MADKSVWFITGAGRGMGVDIVRAALAAGHAVVASGRNTTAVAEAVGDADDLLVVELDVTSLASAKAGVRAAVDRFRRIDVVVNNAGNFHAGFFEELTPEQIERQLTTSLVGPMMSPVPFCPLCASSGREPSSRSRPPLGSSGRSSARLTPPRSSASRDGWSRCGSRSSLSESERRSSSRASSGPPCSKRSRQRTPSYRSTTTPSGPPRRARRGRR